MNEYKVNIIYKNSEETKIDLNDIFIRVLSSAICKKIENAVLLNCVNLFHEKGGLN